MTRDIVLVSRLRIHDDLAVWEIISLLLSYDVLYKAQLTLLQQKQIRIRIIIV